MTNIKITDELFQELLSKSRFDQKNQFPESVPFASLHGENIAFADGITCITGQAKSGKSAVLQMLISASIQENLKHKNYGLEVTPNNRRKAVIHFDTEQSGGDINRFNKNIKSRTGLKELPLFYHSFRSKIVDTELLKPFLEKICEIFNEVHYGIHSIYIDGGADFIRSVNDEDASNSIVNFFTNLAEAYKCPVFLVAHTNPSKDESEKDKIRGHLGSQLERKCHAFLMVTKKNDISYVSTQKMRAGADGISMPFTYIKEYGMHLSMSEIPDKEEDKKITLKGKFDKLGLNSDTLYRATELYALIRNKLQASSSTAERMVALMVKEGLLVKRDKTYKVASDLASVTPKKSWLDLGTQLPFSAELGT